MHAAKTGALFLLSARWGASPAQPAPELAAAVERYAEAFGLAFQVRDDILDASAEAEEIGKPVRQDVERANFVELLGLAGARQLARDLADGASEALRPFGERSRTLSALVERAVADVGS